MNIEKLSDLIEPVELLELPTAVIEEIVAPLEGADIADILEKVSEVTLEYNEAKFGKLYRAKFGKLYRAKMELSEFCSTSLEQHAFITGLMMPFTNLFHPREKLSDSHYSIEGEAHYVQFGEFISTLLILGIILLILWRVL
jgi:hypothetical protein